MSTDDGSRITLLERRRILLDISALTAKNCRQQYHLCLLQLATGAFSIFIFDLVLYFYNPLPADRFEIFTAQDIAADEELLHTYTFL
jgi:hypothetical protein